MQRLQDASLQHGTVQAGRLAAISSVMCPPPAAQ